METALAPATGTLPAAPSGVGGNAGFANPLRQVRDLLGQPAIKRSLPLIFMIGLIAAAALAYMSLRTPSQRILFANLTDSDKAAVTQALTTAGIDSNIDNAGSLTVAEDDYHKARMLLASQDLPKAAPGGYQILDNLPMGVSRAVEGERLRQARETELAKSIEEIDSVADARVHLAMPESSVFVRDQSAPSASVILKLEPGRSLSDAQVQSIINLVASSVPGMKPDAVTIVDQMGALLSQGEGKDPASAAGDARIDYQRRIEDKYRQQLSQLLTPLVGAGNFTAEVQADVDLDQSQATRESYGKDGTLTREQGSWQANQDSANNSPGGIPGALSNTAPGPTTVTKPDATANPTAPAAQTTQSSQTVSTPDASGAAPKTSEQYARAYALGKEISVTQNVPGAVKRLSVAVLLRDPDGKPRSKVEIQQITDLVRAAVGYDPNRNDQVTVISRKFSASPLKADQPAWYEADWVPVAARNATALVIALLVLMLGVRPLSRALLKKRDDAPKSTGAVQRALSSDVERRTDGQMPVGLDKLAGARSIDERVGLVQGFSRDNPSRAALAVRDMMMADKG